MNIVANRLNYAIENLGITAKELSKRSGVSEQDISHYRKGDWMPKRDKCYRLATALNVSPVWLWGLDYNEQSIEDLWSQLTDDNKEQVRNYLIFLISQQTQEAKDV